MIISTYYSGKSCKGSNHAINLCWAAAWAHPIHFHRYTSWSHKLILMVDCALYLYLYLDPSLNRLLRFLSSTSLLSVSLKKL